MLRRLARPRLSSCRYSNGSSRRCRTSASSVANGRPCQSQVAWQTSNAAVALVDAATGEIEAWAPGDATVTIASGGATADITVKVTATIQSLRTLTIRAYDEKAIKDRGIRTALLAKLDAA